MVSNESNNNAYYLFSICPEYIFKITLNTNFIIEFYNSRILNILYILEKHYNTQLKLFIDLVTVDILKNKLRFQNSYNILSILYNTRYIFKTCICKYNTIESIINIYSNSNWYERESWDLFGIVYISHNDLRRILNDYNYKGYPLRKDFPLLGFIELKYNFLKKNIICRPVNPLYKFKLYKNKYNWKFI
jgi:NADH dehydrogenase (ubiquinone) Fe-S protein 3